MKRLFGAIGGTIGGAIIGYPVSYFFQEPMFRAKVPIEKYLSQFADVLSHGGNPVSDTAITITAIGAILGFIIGLFSAK